MAALQEQTGRMPEGLKRRLWPAALALLLLAGAVGIAVDERGGWVNVFGLPPALDASAPAAQNGFTLVALQAPPDQDAGYQYQPDADGGAGPQAPGTLRIWGVDLGTDGKAGGVWVRLPPATYFTAHDITATGRASTGETFPLRVTIPQSENSEQFLFTTLPGGYPDGVKFMDLTLTSRQGPTARWRITRLPRMRHVSPPPDPQDIFDRDGARLTLQATRQSYRGRPGAYIRYRLSPAIAPHAHQWEVETDLPRDDARTDWVGYSHGMRQQGGMPLTGPGAQQMIAFLHGAVQEDFIQNPFVANDHFVTVSGTMTQFETYDERLTFHDVRAEAGDGPPFFTVTRPQAHTTPSGIMVTLPAQSQGTTGERGLLLDVSPSAARNTLDRSPLARTYHRPVEIALSVTQLGTTETLTGPGPHRRLDFYVPGRKPMLLPTLTVIVRQRVDIQSWPLSLTAPIQDTQTTPDGLVPVPPEGMHS